MPVNDYDVAFPTDRIDARRIHATPGVSLTMIVALVSVGMVLRQWPGFHASCTPYLRRWVFGVCQPLNVLRSAWLARLDPQLSFIAIVSCAVHVCLAVFWRWLFSQVRQKQTRGWLLLSVQGSLMSFLYTTVGTHNKFGERALAVCLMWDMAGNMWISQGLLYYLAALHAPKKISKKAEIDLEDVEANGLISGKVLIDEGVKTKKLLHVMLVTQPTLPASLVGLLLGLSGLGMSPATDQVLLVSGKAFRYGLYILLGLYATLSSDLVAKRLIAASLSLRFLVYGLLAVMLWLYLPIGDMARTTIAISVLAPASTQSINLMAEFGYPTEYTEMSATVTTVSVIVAFLIEQAVLSLY